MPTQTENKFDTPGWRRFFADQNARIDAIVEERARQRAAGNSPPDDLMTPGLRAACEEARLQMEADPRYANYFGAPTPNPLQALLHLFGAAFNATPTV